MKQIFEAFVKAQGELSHAVKDAKNPHFKSKYADLTSVVDTLRPILSKNGLAFIQKTHENVGGVMIETMIIHSTGESISGGMLFVPAGKQDPQGYGSALTYARRYSLVTIFGMATEDDDGNSATSSYENQRKAPAPSPAKKIDMSSFIAALLNKNDADSVELLKKQAYSRDLTDAQRFQIDIMCAMQASDIVETLDEQARLFAKSTIALSEEQRNEIDTVYQSKLDKLMIV